MGWGRLVAKRLSFPKKREDIEKVVEEVEAKHEHEEHHHHHHHGVEDEIAGIQMLLESLNSRISDVESKLTQQGLEVARLYKVLAHLVEALMAESEDARRKALTEALKALEEGS
ncbi:MAG: hypothetical protein ACO2O2_15465 [Acidilobaceae archaeon]